MPGTFEATSVPGEYGEKKKRTPIGHVADTFQFGKTGLGGFNAATQSYYGAATPGMGSMGAMQGDTGTGTLSGGSDPSRWGYERPSETPSPYVTTPVSDPVGTPGGGGGGGGGVGGNMPASALTQVIREARGPAPGWNDRPAVGQNIESLGVRTPPMAFEGLSNVVRRFGRVY